MTLVTDLLATTPYFTIAHRGSGGEFPEHTFASYSSAVAAGAKAIEVSVHCTADGVPVCFHDTSLDRMTDYTGSISDWTYAALRENVRVKAQGLLGEGWSDQVIPTLREVLDAYAGKVVIFLEPKANNAVDPTIAVLDEHFPTGYDSIIWKGYYTNGTFAGMRTRGYKTWGYVDPSTTDSQMDAVDANIDIWGVPHTMTDARITDVINRTGGKQVICWEVHRRVEIERLAALGVDGMMSSQWLYLYNEPYLAADLFDSGVSTPGTLPLVNYSDAQALKYDGAGAAYLNNVPNGAALMGCHQVPDGNAYTLSFAMKWGSVPSSFLHSDLAFARIKDDPYQFSSTNDVMGALASPGGYHFVFRGNGDMQLYSHTKGVTSGTQLGSVATATPTAGAWMTFEIQVTSTQVIVRRTDVNPDVTLTVNTTAHRGRYWHLSAGSVNTDATKPYFKDITVS